MKKLGVAILHGMGDQPSHFADALIEELSNRVKKAKANPKEIAFHPIWWSPVIQPREDAMWRAMKQGGELDFLALRRFVLSSLGDAVAYQQPRGAFNDTYSRIHTLVRDDLRLLRTELGDADKPLVVLAHSLGAAIASNYTWDRQQGVDTATFGTTPFERMETLAGLVTFGCNIPLFTLAFQKVESIEFPPPKLAQHAPQLVPVARWFNYYDRDDILAWPLRPLGDFNGDPNSPRRYDRAVSKDIEINVGSPLASWNPVAHSEYWTDNDFTKPVADLLCGILRLL